MFESREYCTFASRNLQEEIMNITRKDIDDLNAVLTVEIAKDDYAPKVDKILKDYRKNANIPGFRKGHVPMGMIKKQYGRAILVDEINKLIQDSIQNYLTDEKLDILGNPIPKNEEEINWESEDYTFEFDLGLTPKFEVDLKKKETIHYKIVADDEMIDNQVKTIRKQYGKLISKDQVEEGDEITGTFTYEAEEDSEIEAIDKTATFATSEIKNKTQLKKLIGAKAGDTLTLKTKGLFVDDHDNQKYLGVSHDQSHGLDIEVTLEITEVNKRELAEMNQELFDKLFGKGEVTSEEELRAKIKEDAEHQFEQQSDQKLLNDVIETLIENTEFDLPEEFLIRWISNAGETELTEEEAKAEYERSEKGLRYQLIEGNLRSENDLNATFEELKQYAKDMIRVQMAQFGQMNPAEEELESITARILSNRDEVERMTEQLHTNKMLRFFKENAKLKTKEVTFEKFAKEAYA